MKFSSLAAMTDLVETSKFDELTGQMVVQTTYDNSAIRELNLADQNAAPEFGKYKGDLCLVGRIHMGDIVRLKNLGYDLLSPDPDEVRRALLYIQGNEQTMLTVPGKPFAKHRNKWQ